MKNILVSLFVAFTIIGCSTDEDVENDSVSIIGKWTLKAQFSSDGADKNIDECVQRSNITFNTNNTFEAYYYRIINGDCTLEDEDKDVEYNLEGDTLEITHKSVNNQGETIVSTKKLKIKYPDSNTLETYEINSDGTTVNSSKDVWIR